MSFTREIVLNLKWLLRARRAPVFHCCVQKTASQWFGRIFRDHLFWQCTRLCVADPHRDFFWNEQGADALLSSAKGVVVSPVYARAKVFASNRIHSGGSVFFVKRDPRDIVVSLFFSTKFSHPSTPAIARARAELAKLSEQDGMRAMLQRHLPWVSDVVAEWSRAEQETAGRIRCFKYEDLFGERQKETFAALMQHCDLHIADDALYALLDKHSFRAITGRAQGQGVQSSHFRKGTSGEWREHFTDDDIRNVDAAIARKLRASGY